MKILMTTILTGFLGLAATQSATAMDASTAMKMCRKELSIGSMPKTVQSSPGVVQAIQECVAKKTGK